VARRFELPVAKARASEWIATEQVRRAEALARTAGSRPSALRGVKADVDDDEPLTPTKRGRGGNGSPSLLPSAASATPAPVPAPLNPASGKRGKRGD
jgi:hypothetical protein